MLSKIKTSLNYRIGKLIRPIRNKFDRIKYRKLQKNGDDFTIISQNCIGTFMYHDLGLKFNSPTVNLFLESKDFIKLAENSDYYLSLDAKDIKFDSSSEEAYPVGMLDDIKIYFVHYKSEQDVIDKWNRRRVRANKNKLFFVMTDKDGCTDEIIERFLKLPYKKVFFLSKNVSHPDVVYMPCFAGRNEIGGGNRFL